MKKFIFVLTLLALFFTAVNSQTDILPDSKNNLSAYRNVSGNENFFSTHSEQLNIPTGLLDSYNSAADTGNEELKIYYGIEIDKYLQKPVLPQDNSGMGTVIKNQPPYNPDWYNSDVMVTNSDVVFSGGFRGIELKQGEDGWMYLAVNRRNVTGFKGYITIYRSSNGGANWQGVISVGAPNSYYGAFSMLVESKNNLVPDSTRILIYYTWSTDFNMYNSKLALLTTRRDGSSAETIAVGSPAAGNRLVYTTACSDGMFYQAATFMHLVAREETNGGTFVSLRHFRTINWGATHSTGSIVTGYNELFPSAAFSVKYGTDSIYIAVERVVSINEHEIRLITTSDQPSNNFTVRYITDAPNGTLYKKPAITIQQRDFNVPQNILITSTKNDHAVYHYSTNGGGTWNIDYNLGSSNQAVDFTSCSSDTLTAGNGYFIAAFVNHGGDSLTVRRGVLGSLGTPQYKRNGNPSTGVLVPACAIYRDGNSKYSAFAYAGYGPSSVYYNMENLITGISPVSNNTPGGFLLSQNYPNPFNPVTNIEFSITTSSFVKLIIFDVTGREVETLVSEQLKPGIYKADWNASNKPSGVYFYKLITESYTNTKKMILVK